MQIGTLKKLISRFFVILLLSSCTSDYIMPDPPPAPPDPNENKISYAGAIQPMFTAKCVACHGVGQALPVLAEGKSYQSLMSISGMVDTVSPGNSTLYVVMASGGSMNNYCKKADADSVYKWIRQGAKNN
jgi:mono/diheme cytochrome c family protein